MSEVVIALDPDNSVVSVVIALNCLKVRLEFTPRGKSGKLAAAVRGFAIAEFLLIYATEIDAAVECEILVEADGVNPATTKLRRLSEDTVACILIAHGN